jgi:secondary thiamine-phosphate synthase enzyme
MTTAERFNIQSQEKQQLVNITTEVARAVEQTGIQNGLVAVYSQHTTAALFVGEWQRALVEDTLKFLEQIVTDDLQYKHNSPEFSDCDRHNATSHLRAMLLSHSIQLPVVAGKPVLGEFQKILFAELDGPRDRTLHLQVIGE